MEPTRNSGRAAKVFTTLFILLLLAIATAGYFFWQWNTLRSNPAISGATENQNLIAEVGKIMLLPDELPTIATVTDPAELGDQPFYVNAQVGYKVLFYSTAKKAVLYDPVNHKIIEVAPLNILDAPPDDGTTNLETESTSNNN